TCCVRTGLGPVPHPGAAANAIAAHKNPAVARIIDWLGRRPKHATALNIAWETCDRGGGLRTRTAGLLAFVRPGGVFSQGPSVDQYGRRRRPRANHGAAALPTLRPKVASAHADHHRRGLRRYRYEPP